MSGDADLRVIVADDEPDVRLLLRLQLESAAGLTVVGEAADGMETIERCRELHPDAVVMDLLMPKMMGLAAIEQLRTEMPAVGVVAYTATAGELVRRETERLGVPLLLKSGDVGQLVAAIRSTVARVE